MDSKSESTLSSSMLTIPGTFSPRKYLGLSASTTLSTCGQSARSSAAPFRFPAKLYGWHGQPAVISSGCSLSSSHPHGVIHGHSPRCASCLSHHRSSQHSHCGYSPTSTAMFLTSPKFSTSGQCLLSILLESSSVSQKPIVLNPFHCAASANPPIPEKDQGASFNFNDCSAVFNGHRLNLVSLFLHDDTVCRPCVIIVGEPVNVVP